MPPQGADKVWSMASGEGDPSRQWGGGADWERLVEGGVSGIQGGWAGAAGPQLQALL